METEGPYTYPLTDRADIIKFLGEHQLYSNDIGGCALAWNIKVHYNFDTSGHSCTSDCEFEKRFDAAWEEVVEQDHEMFWRVCEDATRMYTDEEWTRYPGIEQGEWKFSIMGRSGGWMILEGWPGPTPGNFRSCPLSWYSWADYQQWLEDLEDEDLNTLYKAIVQLDQDLSRENCRKEIEYQYAAHREMWEEEQVEAEKAAARTLEASRPDMYQPED